MLQYDCSTVIFLRYRFVSIKKQKYITNSDAHSGSIPQRLLHSIAAKRLPPAGSDGETARSLLTDRSEITPWETPEKIQSD